MRAEATIIDADLYSGLPDDNELAFLRLEERFRQDLETKLQQSSAAQQPAVVANAYLEYVNRIYAVAQALELPVLHDMQGLELGTAQALFSSKASPQIENYIIQVKIRHGRRAKGYSVALDAVTKEKVRYLIGQIKIIVDRLEVHIQKKEALYARIRDLTDEVDRDRTRIEAYGALAIEMSNTVGKVARNLRPASRILDSIGNLLGMAKDAEAEKPQLRLEAPRLQLAPPSEADAAHSETEPGSPSSSGGS